MNKSVALLGIALFAGAVGAAVFLGSNSDTHAPVSAGQVDDFFDTSAATADRLRALEQAVAEERNARQLLEEELQILFEELDALRPAAPAQGSGNLAQGQAEPRVVTSTARSFRSPEARSERLIEGGFAPDRAEWIVKREAELQVEAMQARFEARRAGEAFDPLDPALNPGYALRNELGDEQYEQYLEANNRPTSVFVRTVLTSSPGETAGLQPGDQITRYDGQRVFDSFNLNQQIMQGEPGGDVVVDVLRNGAPIQIVLPRGPIGVQTGGRGRR